MHGPARPTARAVDWIAILLLLLAGAWVLAARSASDEFPFLVWTDRDLVRAAGAWWSLPTAGAELSYGSGARLPGGFQYTLLWIGRQLSTNPMDLRGYQLVVEALAGLVLAGALARLLGPLPAALAAFLWWTSPAVSEVGRALWNPGQLALPLALAWAGWWMAVGRRDGRWLVLWGLGIGLGLQLHATMALLAMLQAAALVVTPFPRRVAWLGAGLGAAVVTLLPHLADEARHGWPNTRLLLEQPYVSRASSAVGTDHAGARLDVVWRSIAARPWLGAALLALASLGVARGRHRMWPASVAVVVGLIVWITLDRDLGVHGFGGMRYALFALPGFAGLLAAGAGVLLEARSSQALRLAVVVLLTAPTLLQANLAVTVGLDPSNLPQTWRSLRDNLQGVRAATGWSLREVAGRTAILGQSGSTWNRHGERAIDALLLDEGATFPGSLPPPCGLVIWGPQRRNLPATPDAAALASVLPGYDAAGITVLGADPLPDGELWRYHLAEGRCPTVFTNRYLPTAEEEEAWAAVAPLAAPVAVVIAPGRYAIGLDAHQQPPIPSDRIAIALTIAPAPGVLQVHLASNQLRGRSYNSGFYATQVIDRPRLVLRGAQGEHVVPLEPGLLGNQFALPPLDVTALVPAGTWTVRFETEVVDGLRLDLDLRTLPWRTVGVDLPEPLQVP